MATFAYEMTAISEQLERWSAELDYRWRYATEIGEQAALVAAMERRIALLCPAISTLAPTPGLEGLHARLLEAVRVRHTWAVLAAEELNCCGMLASTQFDVGRLATHDEVLAVARLVEELENYDLPLARSLEIGMYGIVVPRQPGWVTSSVSGAQLFIAPVSEQQPTLGGLGPSTWRLGSALRVKRFGNSSPITVVSALERFGGLLTGLGEPGEPEPSEFAGHEAMVTLIEDKVNGWQFNVTLVVTGGFTYVFDYGCPLDQTDICRIIDSFTDGLIIES